MSKFDLYRHIVQCFYGWMMYGVKLYEYDVLMYFRHISYSDIIAFIKVFVNQDIRDSLISYVENRIKLTQ